eukprot:15352481-Ditylum_brightwellii.AAC.1
MLTSDIVNRNAQFLIGIKEAIQTTDIITRIPCSVIDVYAANFFALANKFSPTYMVPEDRRKGGTSGFVCDICIGQDGFSKLVRMMIINKVDHKTQALELHC